MANFVFYKYRFEKTDERTLFDRETGEELTESSINDKFAADLASKAENRNSLNLYDIKADKQGVTAPESYANDIGVTIVVSPFLMYVITSTRM